MADNLNDKLSSLLSNPDAMNMLSSLIGSSAQGSSPSEAEPASGGDEEIVSTIKNAMSRLSGGGDKRINLLNALRPYMRESRTAGIDKAVKMLKLTQLTSIFKDL
ncbi:MAG: hypothetical protein E7395_08555 [Ruminococcaceae bacterium]|nr:hypothetical protein [Oscillospiraceae bacterium]